MHLVTSAMSPVFIDHFTKVALGTFGVNVHALTSNLGLYSHRLLCWALALCSFCIYKGNCSSTDDWNHLYFYVCRVICHEKEQHPNRLLPFAVQHHRHFDLVPCSSDAQGGHPSRLHPWLLCLLLAVGSPHLHLGHVCGSPRLVLVDLAPVHS